MSIFEIWSEGYLVSGMEGIPSEPHMHGRQEGVDFADACQNLAERDPGFRAYFDAARLTYWGCRLYPTHPVKAQP